MNYSFKLITRLLENLCVAHNFVMNNIEINHVAQKRQTLVTLYDFLILEHIYVYIVEKL